MKKAPKVYNNLIKPAIHKKINHVTPYVKNAAEMANITKRAHSHFKHVKAADVRGHAMNLARKHALPALKQKVLRSEQKLPTIESRNNGRDRILPAKGL